MSRKNYFFRKNKKNDYNIKLSKNEKSIGITVGEDIANLKKMLSKYSIAMLSIFLVVVFVLVLSGSYAFFTYTTKAKEFVIYTGTLAVDYTKKTDVINIFDLYPMTNTQGLNQTAHEFNVTNNGNINARYQVRLELDNSIKDLISPEYVKLAYSVDGGGYSEPVLLSNLGSNLVFLKDMKLTPTNSNTIAIKLWIDINAPNDIQGKTFKARVVVDSIQDVDDGYVVDTAPIIYLNKDASGNQDINLKVGQTYAELGVNRVEDDSDVIKASQITKTYEYYDGTNLSTVASVDTSKTGIYYVTYSVKDSSNNTGKAIRIVTVNNSGTIPTITLNGDSTITLERTEEYVETGVTVAEGNQVVTIGEVKTSTAGSYVVRYIVVDSNGNMNSVIRTVNIIDSVLLSEKIFAHNTLIEAEPTLTTTSAASGESGLYKSTATNSGEPTYYFRGAVENNYVEFAGQLWRIVRINEDGTVRLIMQDGINNNAEYKFSTTYNSYTNMYYSNSDIAKLTIELWYQTNIESQESYLNRIASGDYYCEEAKVKHYADYTSGNADMVLYLNYAPTFKCNNDKNSKGIVDESVGLITYDEVVYAGAYFGKDNSDYYLSIDNSFWTMSPAGVTSDPYALDWYIFSTGALYPNSVANADRVLRPVINLKADTEAIGLGTSDNPYKVVETPRNFSEAVVSENTLIEAEPTLTNSSNNTSDASGLYKSTATNSGEPTYYFRGAVENNYVDFAGFTWRILRINEDGTVRLIMQDGINNNSSYVFNSGTGTVDYMYYSNSGAAGAKYALENWYKDNISNNYIYANKVEAGSYYCEQAKVSFPTSTGDSGENAGTSMTLYNKYTPDFKCSVDANEYGIINSNVGLISYDEVIYAGGYFTQAKANDSFYLYNNASTWTMSPAGVVDTSLYVYYINSTGFVGAPNTSSKLTLRPVINLKIDTMVTGSGTVSNPYKVIY